MSRISIILPTYNEEGNILKLSKILTQILKKITNNFEIIIVDDNSQDKTVQLVKKYSNNNNHIKLFVRQNKRSLAKSILLGIKKAQGNYLVVMDSDFNHDPKIIPQMIILLNYYDMVIGSRYVFGGGMDDKARERASFFYNLFIRIVLKTRMSDNLSGYFCISKSNLESLPLSEIFYGYGDYFIRLLLFAKLKRLNLIEIPTWYRIRNFGESKSNLISMLYHYTKTVLELRKEKP